MPGLFWKPHSAHTLAALPSAALAAATGATDAAAANAVPQARQNWASSLFSLPHTEQTLLIASSPRPLPVVERRYLGLSAVAIWCDPRAMDNARTVPRPELPRAVCVPEGVPSAR